MDQIFAHAPGRGLEAIAMKPLLKRRARLGVTFLRRER